MPRATRCTSGAGRQGCCTSGRRGRGGSGSSRHRDPRPRIRLARLQVLLDERHEMHVQPPAVLRVERRETRGIRQARPVRDHRSAQARRAQPARLGLGAEDGLPCGVRSAALGRVDAWPDRARPHLALPAPRGPGVGGGDVDASARWAAPRGAWSVVGSPARRERPRSGDHEPTGTSIAATSRGGVHERQTRTEQNSAAPTLPFRSNGSRIANGAHCARVPSGPTASSSRNH